jgi:phosphatidylinositol 4-kinase
MTQWRLKDKILSAGLGWFRAAPTWSFGSSVLQLKTEVHLLADVIAALNAVAAIGANTVGNIKSLRSKEQLLHALLENEQTRLMVWINPLNKPTVQVGVSNPPKPVTEAALLPLVRTAWWQDPGIAIELATRFKFPRLLRDIRFLLLTMPEKAVFEAEALPLMFGGHLPDDVLPQLRVSCLNTPA